MTKRKAMVGLVIAVFAGLVALDWQSRAQADRENGANQPKVKKNAKNQKPKKPLLAKFMRAKLTASSQVLEGLCTEDFDLITKGAKRLHRVSKSEQWRVSNDAIYRQHSLEFRSGVERLLKAAKNKKLDSVALAWTKTTLNCVECHRWVRAELIAEK